MPRGRASTYDPVILPAVRAAAFFGATQEEIASYLNVPYRTFCTWMISFPELANALKINKEQADRRVEDSLYQQALKGVPSCIIFWLKNRKPSEWRDVQNIQGEVGHYIIADRPLTEDEWIEQRTKLIDAKASGSDTAALPQDQDDTAKPLD